MPPTVVSGAQTSSDIPSALKVLDMSKEIFRLDPDVAPVLKILTQIGSAAVAVNTTHSWWEDPEDPKFVKASAGVSSSGTSLTVDYPAYVKVGDTLVVQVTEEVLYITAKNATTGVLTIVRGDPGSEIPQNAVLTLMDSAEAESSSGVVSPTISPAEESNYLQISSEYLDLSRTEIKISLAAGGNTEEEKLAQIGKRVLRKLEQRHLWGKKGTRLDASGNTVRFMGGIVEYISTNRHVVTDVFSEEYFNDCLIQDFQWGAEEKWAIGSGLVLSKVSGWGLGKLVLDPGKSQTYGLHVYKYITGDGHTLYLVPHPLFKGANALDWTGFGGMLMVLDFSCFRKRYLTDSDIKLYKNLPNAADSVLHRWLGETGMDRRNEAKNAFYSGIKK